MRRYEARQCNFALPTPVGLGELMAFFMIYGDEAGKLEKSDYTSYCGYVGHVAEWERVSMEWNSMRLTWGIPPLHMRCLYAPERSGCKEWQEVQKQWGADWESKRDYMLLEFGQIIRNSSLACVGSVVDAKYFRSMPDSEFKRRHKESPFFMGLHTLVMEALDKIDRVDKCQSVSLIIDEDYEYGKQIYDMLSAMKIAFERVKQRISAITFGRDNDYPGLQMADMVAYEARTWMVKRIQNSNEPPSDLFGLLTKMGVHPPKAWTAEFLDKAAQAQR